jgi:amino acid transporter
MMGLGIEILQPHIGISPVSLIWLAGAVQLAMVAMNAALPPRLKTRENLNRVDPIIRQVFYSHWFFVMLAVLIFGVPCFAFAADMAGKSNLVCYLSGALAVFWIMKLFVQLFEIDKQFRRDNRMADLLTAIGTVYLIALFGAAAWGFLR